MIFSNFCDELKKIHKNNKNKKLILNQISELEQDFLVIENEVFKNKIINEKTVFEIKNYIFSKLSLTESILFNFIDKKIVYNELHNLRNKLFGILSNNFSEKESRLTIDAFDTAISPLLKNFYKSREMELIISDLFSFVQESIKAIKKQVKTNKELIVYDALDKYTSGLTISAFIQKVTHFESKMESMQIIKERKLQNGIAIKNKDISNKILKINKNINHYSFDFFMQQPSSLLRLF